MAFGVTILTNRNPRSVPRLVSVVDVVTNATGFWHNVQHWEFDGVSSGVQIGVCQRCQQSITRGSGIGDYEGGDFGDLGE